MKPFANRPGGAQPWEHIPANVGEKFEVGMALELSAGKASKVSGEDKPVYLSMYKGVGEADKPIPVMPIYADQKLSARLSEDGKALSVGDKVKISDDGMDATATTGGALEIVAINGTNVGDEIIVRVV